MTSVRRKEPVSSSSSGVNSVNQTLCDCVGGEDDDDEDSEFDAIINGSDSDSDSNDDDGYDSGGVSDPDEPDWRKSPSFVANYRKMMGLRGGSGK